MDDDKLRVQARLDAKLVRRANQMMLELGLTPTGLITMTYQQLVHERALPFTPQLQGDLHKFELNCNQLDVYQLVLVPFKQVMKHLRESDKSAVSGKINTARVVQPWSLKAFKQSPMKLWEHNYESDVDESITRIQFKSDDETVIDPLIAVLQDNFLINKVIVLDMGKVDEYHHQMELFILDRRPFEMDDWQRLKAQINQWVG